jgi:hypothetical protein
MASSVLHSSGTLGTSLHLADQVQDIVVDQGRLVTLLVFEKQPCLANVHYYPGV